MDVIRMDPKLEFLPKPAKIRATAAKFERGQIRKATRQHYVAPDNSAEVDENENPLPQNYQPTGRFGPPKHIGMRRHVEIPLESRWREEGSA